MNSKNNRKRHNNDKVSQIFRNRQKEVNRNK